MNKSSDVMSQGRLPSLDGMRAVAILMVIAFHVCHTEGYPLPRWTTKYFDQGAIGVDIFFAISGFLITTLLIRERARSGRISSKDFYARRACRILPAFVVYLLAVAVLEHLAAIPAIPFRVWLGACTYTINFVHSVRTPLDHIWSLSVEEHFYLLWPPGLILLGIRTAGWIAGICILSESLIRWTTWKYCRGIFDIDFATFTRLDAIAAGCLLAILGSHIRGQNFLKYIERKHHRNFIVALFAFALSLMLSSRYGTYNITIGPTINALLICSMLWLAVKFESAWYGKFLNWRPLAKIGILSYSLYLWQHLFLYPYNSNWFGRFPVNVIFAIIFAVLSYYLVETPFLKLKNHFRPAREGFGGQRAQGF